MNQRKSLVSIDKYCILIRLKINNIPDPFYPENEILRK